MTNLHHWDNQEEWDCGSRGMTCPGRKIYPSFPWIYIFIHRAWQICQWQMRRKLRRSYHARSRYAQRTTTTSLRFSLENLTKNNILQCLCFHLDELISTTCWITNSCFAQDSLQPIALDWNSASTYFPSLHWKCFLPSLAIPSFSAPSFTISCSVSVIPSSFPQFSFSITWATNSLNDVRVDLWADREPKCLPRLVVTAGVERVCLWKAGHSESYSHMGVLPVSLSYWFLHFRHKGGRGSEQKPNICLLLCSEQLFALLDFNRTTV